MKVVSHLPGRLRIRGRALRHAEHNQSMVADAGTWPGVRQVVGNPATGSVLIHYDPATLPPAQLEHRLLGADSPPDRPQPSSGPALPALKDINRPAKIGLLVSMAVTLLALGSNKKLHAMAGAAHVAFLAVHLLYHRKRMLK